MLISFSFSWYNFYIILKGVKNMKTWLVYVFGRWIFLSGIAGALLQFLLSDYLRIHTIPAFLLNQFILANVFWFVDKAIFKSHFKIPAFYPLWQIKENVVCADCGEICEGYRLVKTKNYDKLSDPQPEFRCKTCRERKLQELRERGVEV
jgi:hypothetical protein